MNGTDTTTLSYWLNWRVAFCGTWVLLSIIIAVYIISKCERWKFSPVKCDAKHESSDVGVYGELPQLFYYDDDAWRTCLKQIHPVWLLGFRLISFSLFLAVLILDILHHGPKVFYYYTQWTFTLVTIYFGLGTGLSLYGCCNRHKIRRWFHTSHVGIDSGEESYVPLLHGCETDIMVVAKDYLQFGTGVWGFIFQVIFQVIAGAVLLTDIIYWLLIFPFLTLKDYDLNYMTYILHSLNALFLLGDTALNCLRFPWYRFGYFALWTAMFVVTQWVIHIFISIWWPYPFLDLSYPLAPLWYVLVTLMHIPCYAIFALIVKMKVCLLSKLFPHSSQCFS